MSLSPAQDDRQGDNLSPFERAELLLVDDDADAAEALAEALETEGYRVRMAGDGQKGLARLDEGLPDMVVLDVEMPVLDGPAMALQMFLTDGGREKIPILLCSGIRDLSSWDTVLLGETVHARSDAPPRGTCSRRAQNPDTSRPN
jgi:CheY-like chemotaxis protein